METRLFGKTGERVAVVGQGTWMMEKDPAASIAALRRGIEAGMTHIDTAEMYGSGRAEAVVGRAIEGIRDRLFLVSKVLPSNASYNGTLKACERSLKHLKTDRLDLYLLHWPGSHPLEETFKAFDKLRADGKIRHYGVSNFDEREMEAAVSAAGEGNIVCNQVIYHLKERVIEHAVIPFCVQRGIAVVGYSPFGNGDFPSPDSRGGKVLEEVARARGATPRQVALRFLIRNGVFTIPKAAKPDHALDNAAAGDLKLTDDDLRRIDEAFPLGPPKKSLPMI